MGQQRSKTAAVTSRLRVAAVALLVVGALVAPVSVDAGAASERGATPRGASSGTRATLQVESPAVQVKRAGTSTFVDAKDGRRLKPGDTVRTSSTGRAEISYADGSLTRLDVDTEYKLVKLSVKRGERRTKGLQTAGQTWHRVEALTENESYQVQGANATAAVLGTAFRVLCTPRGVVPKQCTYTAVIDSVVLTDRDLKGGTKTVTLTPGDQVVVTNNAIGTVTELTEEELLAIQWIVQNLLDDEADDKSTGIDEVRTQDDPPRSRPPSSAVVTPPPLAPAAPAGAGTGTGAGTGAGTGTGTPPDVGGGETGGPPPNQGPTANDDAYSMPEDTLLAIAAPGVLGNDHDPEGSALEAFLTSLPAHGSLTFQGNGAFVYFPDTNFHGTDTFTYAAGDGEFGSLPATVTITVGAANDAPIALGDGFSTAEDTPLVIAAPGVLANDTDPDGDTLAAVVETGPSHGALTLDGNGSFTYSPFPDFTGSDAFTYRASDGTAQSAPATVTISVGSANDAPVATNDTYETNEDEPLTVPAPGVLANDFDPDGNPLTAVLEPGGEGGGSEEIQILSTVSDGQLTLNPDGSFTYTPDENFSGTDSFTYRAFDGSAPSNEATVTITVDPVNDGPVATADEYEVAPGETLTVAAPGVLENDSDIDNDAGDLTATLVQNIDECMDFYDFECEGTLAFNSDGSFVYTPPSEFTGTVTFTYTVSDGAGTSNVASVTISVEVPCTSPEAQISPESVTPPQGETVEINITAFDSCNETLSEPTHTSIGNPATLVLTDSGSEGNFFFWTYVYDPNTCESAGETITFTVSNSAGSTNVSVTIDYQSGGCTL